MTSWVNSSFVLAVNILKQKTPSAAFKIRIYIHKFTYNERVYKFM